MNASELVKILDRFYVGCQDPLVRKGRIIDAEHQETWREHVVYGSNCLLIIVCVGVKLNIHVFILEAVND